MKNISIGKILITSVALETALASYLFDWNETHIFNPHFTPHAKFHSAQTMLLGTLLGLFVLWLLWIEKNFNRNTLKLTIVLSSFYWLGQVGAFFFPGTALVDPKFIKNGPPAIQLVVCIIMFSLLCIAYFLETNRMKKLS